MKRHVYKIQTNAGEMEVIDVKRTSNKPKLRFPYEYVVPRKEYQEAYKKLKDFLKSKKPKFQYADVWRECISRGVRFEFFALAYAPELRVGNIDDGISKEEWDTTVDEVQKQIFKLLGKDADIYRDKYTKKDKFQARFAAYIMYAEMKD